MTSLFIIASIAAIVYTVMSRDYNRCDVEEHVFRLVKLPSVPEVIWLVVTGSAMMIAVIDDGTIVMFGSIVLTLTLLFVCRFWSQFRNLIISRGK